MKKPHQPGMINAITNVHIFDGERLTSDQTVVIGGATIQAVSQASAALPTAPACTTNCNYWRRLD